MGNVHLLANTTNTCSSLFFFTPKKIYHCNIDNFRAADPPLFPRRDYENLGFPCSTNFVLKIYCARHLNLVGKVFQALSFCILHLEKSLDAKHILAAFYVRPNIYQRSTIGKNEKDNKLSHRWKNNGWRIRLKRMFF